MKSAEFVITLFKLIWNLLTLFICWKSIVIITTYVCQHFFAGVKQFSLNSLFWRTWSRGGACLTIEEALYLPSTLLVPAIHSFSPACLGWIHIGSWFFLVLFIEGHILTMAWLLPVHEAHMLAPWRGTGGKSLFSKTNCSATSWACRLICVNIWVFFLNLNFGQNYELVTVFWIIRLLHPPLPWNSIWLEELCVVFEPHCWLPQIQPESWSAWEKSF